MDRKNDMGDGLTQSQPPPSCSHSSAGTNLLPLHTHTLTHRHTHTPTHKRILRSETAIQLRRISIHLRSHGDISHFNV